MKIKVLVGALVLLIVMNIAAIAAFLVVQARHPRGPGDWHAFIHERPLAGLDREQRRALIRSMRQFHRETRDLWVATHALEDQAIAAMSEDPVRRAHIDSLLQRIAENRLEIARQATNRMIEMGEALTPAEREHLMSALVRMRGAGVGVRPRWRDDAPAEEPEE